LESVCVFSEKKKIVQLDLKAAGLFLKKGIKNIKFGKGEPVGNNLKNGYLPPVDRAGNRGAGDLPPIGREVPEGLLANKKVILFAKRSLWGHPARWSGGRSPWLYKPLPALKLSFYSVKTKKKGGDEERRESGEALFTRQFRGIFSFQPYNYLKITII
jgi:hypothetical protein